jgi:hypothetical protein
MCGQQVPGPILENVVDWRDSRSTTGESRKMTDVNLIPTHQVQAFHHESHGDCQSVEGVIKQLTS